MKYFNEVLTLCVVIVAFYFVHSYIVTTQYDAYASCFAQSTTEIDASNKNIYAICGEIMTHQYAFPFQPASSL